MCSILGVFDLRPGADLRPLRPLALSLSARQRHRGPDWSGVHAEPRCLLVHERLAIVDPAGGSQPLRSNALLERLAQSLLYASDEKAEGASAFLEKRPARFRDDD